MKPRNTRNTREERKGKNMKLKVNWKELMKQLWAAIKPVLLGAIGGGIVGVSSGCSSMAPSDKTQTMGVYAFGIPGIAVITQSHQTADNAGSDTNAAAQSNPVSVDTKVK
ncbi:MAG: hypothetical protein J6N18_11180 [Kiritimatiellae bacterium]|nr:hypothetical protein [Kiritimatiellia bacterium]